MPNDQGTISLLTRTRQPRALVIPRVRLASLLFASFVLARVSLADAAATNAVAAAAARHTPTMRGTCSSHLVSADAKQRHFPAPAGAKRTLPLAILSAGRTRAHRHRQRHAAAAAGRRRRRSSAAALSLQRIDVLVDAGSRAPPRRKRAATWNARPSAPSSPTSSSRNAFLPPAAACFSARVP